MSKNLLVDAVKSKLARERRSMRTTYGEENRSSPAPHEEYRIEVADLDAIARRHADKGYQRGRNAGYASGHQHGLETGHRVAVEADRVITSAMLNSVDERLSRISGQLAASTGVKEGRVRDREEKAEIRRKAEELLLGLRVDISILLAEHSKDTFAPDVSV